MWRTSSILLLVCGLTVPAAARGRTNQLLTITTPFAKKIAPAHPHVNVIVRFSKTPDGYVPDPTTFHARLGRHDITARFHPVTNGSAVVGMRAALLPPQIHLGRHANNRLRFEVRSLPRTGPGPRIVRDVDRLRFHALQAENQPPVASLVPPSDVIFPDVDLQFDATGSSDPELDELTYAWDFGDDAPSTDPKPVHSFHGGSGDAVIHLTVSDGAANAVDQVTLIECPLVDSDRTAGTLQIAGTQALEFGSVAPGTSKDLAFTVVNPDTTGTSQLRAQVRAVGAAFTVTPASFVLGPGESQPVTLTFAPPAPGHQSADVVVVASGSNRCAMHLVAHGFGGTAPGTGPTMASSPVFYNSFTTGLQGILPDGTRFNLNTDTHVCQTPNNGIGTGDLCMVDADCAANGGTCNQALPGQFFTVDACSDGQGSLYLMSDEGSYTDPSPTQNDLSITILRLDLDANGGRVGADIVTRMTSGSTQLACDHVPANAGGRLYAVEFLEVDTPAQCIRSEQESLLAIHKSTGAKDPPLLSRIDAAEGLDACNDDVDQVADLNVSPDGLTAFASFEEGGLFQIRPSFRMITPDVTSAFQLHPDGDIVIVVPSNNGSTGILSVYRISPQQAVSGAVNLNDIQPCATFKVPNNGWQGIGQLAFTGDHSFAIGPTSAGSFDATLLVGFYTSGAVGQGLPTALRVQGVAAFSLPAGTGSCSALGIVNLDLADSVTF